MIKSFTAVTREIDNAQAAVAEITASLNLDGRLLKYSLGIISCFSEFGETGVLKAVCDALPFDCIGATSCLCAAGSEYDQIILTITVLTSDDCEFRTVTASITENYSENIENSLNYLLKQSGEKPAMFLSYFPLITTISGDMMLSAIDKVTGGIPLFGTMAVDHMITYDTANTIFNGELFRETVVLCGVYGNPKIDFEVASIDENKIRKQRAVITESEDNNIIGVNGKNVLEYLEEIGLTQEELFSGLGVIPLVVDHRDGTKPVARAVFTLTPDGHAVCGGAMPVGASLGIGHIDMQDVINTTEETLKQFRSEDGFILIYSCIARYFVQGLNSSAEASKIIDIMGGNNYMFAYSGGEICSLPDASGKLKNYFHNYTIVFCRIS